MVALSSLIPPVNLAAANGTLPVGNGGTGQTGYTNGQLLIGNSTNSALTKATLTAGAGITVTNGAGSITLGYDPIGLVEVATYTVTTGVTAINITNIPQTYDNIYIQLTGFITNGGMPISARTSNNNGSSYSTADALLFATSATAGPTWTGCGTIMNYTRDNSIGLSGPGGRTDNGDLQNVAGSINGLRNVGGINAIRIRGNDLNNFTAGTVKIFGWNCA
jgi:hypothetical protein